MNELVEVFMENKEITYPIMAFVVTGLTQALKTSFPALKGHAELVAPVLGLMLGLIVGATQGDYLAHGLLGVIAGLAGSGIFDVATRKKETGL